MNMFSQMQQVGTLARCTITVRVRQNFNLKGSKFVGNINILSNFQKHHCYLLKYLLKKCFHIMERPIPKT